MEFYSLAETIFEECKRLQRNKKVEDDVFEAFESAPEFEEIPIDLQRRIDEKIFFSDGPEVTTPADEFVFSN